MPSSGITWSYGNFISPCFKECPYHCSWWLYQFTSHPQCKGVPFLCTLSSIYSLSNFWLWPFWPCEVIPYATPFCFMRSASQFPSSMSPWVSLDITKSHPDTSRGGSGEIQMVWRDKRSMWHAPYEPKKLTCHNHLSKSTLMCRMSEVVCHLQTWLHSHSVRALILFPLTFHHYLVFNILPKIPPW